MGNGFRAVPAGRQVRRLLVLRTGSIGDTVTTLPVFRMLAHEFPDAERKVLTNIPINRDAAPLRSVLGESGLVHGYFAYPAGTRSPGKILALQREIMGWQPDLAVYLNEPRSLAATLRDVVFLRLCGVRRIGGLPFRRGLRRHRKAGGQGLWESESARLARCVEEVGKVDLTNPNSWSLEFSHTERREAERALADWPGADHFIAFSIGAKIDYKSWGDDNWRRVLDAVSRNHPELGLVMVGGADDKAASQRAAEIWQGPVLNLCGRTPPRISALVIARAVLYMGHDSGPMHLAASVGTRAVAVFSTHARPGVWFPCGNGHRVFYPGLSWSGGDPPVMRDAAGETNITLIPPDQVIAACEARLFDHEDGRAAQ